MVSIWLHLALQHIRQVVPWEEPAVNTKKNARRNCRVNKQRWGSLCVLSNTYPPKYWRRNNNIMPNQTTSIVQWEFRFRVVKHRRRVAQTPRADNDKQGLSSTDGFRVFSAAQPGLLPANHRKRPRTSARNWEVPKKSSAVPKIHRHRQIL